MAKRRKIGLLCVLKSNRNEAPHLGSLNLSLEQDKPWQIEQKRVLRDTCEVVSWLFSWHNPSVNFCSTQLMYIVAKWCRMLLLVEVSLSWMWTNCLLASHHNVICPLSISTFAFILFESSLSTKFIWMYLFYFNFCLNRLMKTALKTLAIRKGLSRNRDF